MAKPEGKKPKTPVTKTQESISRHAEAKPLCCCAARTWRDLTKVQRRVRMPSPLLSSLTSRRTRNKRKNVMDTFPLSPLPWSKSRYLGKKHHVLFTSFLSYDTSGVVSPHHDRRLPGSVFFVHNQAVRRERRSKSSWIRSVNSFFFFFSDRCL